ncbi:flagellar assembly protein FliW [Wukongibacter sp. M2B1]|uniref:flagellar assembly protein FliW n=1 Tax=Wukongibacter sp. M2B1 TaxID=3088895 RepID=UPI003D7B77BD
MKLNTKHFGEVEVEEENIIFFSEGIPAFENVKKYVIIKNPNSELPFDWLQGVDEPNLTFVIVNPFLFKENYEFDIPQATIDSLAIESQKDIFIYCIVTVPENVTETTMNLKAPIIINIKEKRGRQLVLETDEYEVKYKIFKKTAL